MDRIFSCSISYASVFVVMHYINGALIVLFRHLQGIGRCGEIGSVTASDIDSTDDGKITYSIVSGNMTLDSMEFQELFIFLRLSQMSKR